MPSFQRPTNSNGWSTKFPSLTISDDPTHPLQIALRTYALSLTLSLGPSLIPFLTGLLKPSTQKSSTTRLPALLGVLRRELGADGFAFAITTAVGGGAALTHLWAIIEESRDWPWDRHEISRQKCSESRQTSTAVRAWTKLRATVGLLHLTPWHKVFISNIVSSSFAVMLLQAGRRRSARLKRRTPAPAAIPFTIPIHEAESFVKNESPTLDLTILLLVRAVDALVQCFVFKRTETQTVSSLAPADTPSREDSLQERLDSGKESADLGRRRSRITTQIDAFVFWACSARIMWCFFYEPHRLPASYVRWIGTLAKIDPRLLKTLVALRSGEWAYGETSPRYSHLLTTLSTDLGYPSLWGDPAAIPPRGGPAADAVWKALGVNRKGLGGVPCELVHNGICAKSGINDSCISNISLRAVLAFAEAIAIYIPAHFLPLLLARPRSLLRFRRIISTNLSALRSATFLSTFITSLWFTVCATRTLFLARLFPKISHNFWDGPYGCPLAGSLICGSSIWIEDGRRRGEMALYVLPRAVRAFLPVKYVQKSGKGTRIIERFVFVLSLSSLLTAAIHRPDSLRGLSRWTLAFILKGPNAGFWKRKRESPSILPTPARPETPKFLNLVQEQN